MLNLYNGKPKVWTREIEGVKLLSAQVGAHEFCSMCVNDDEPEQVEYTKTLLSKHTCEEVIACFEWMEAYDDDIESAGYHLENGQFGYTGCDDWPELIDTLIDDGAFGEVDPLIKDSIDYDMLRDNMGDTIYIDNDWHEGWYFETSKGVFYFILK